MSAIQIVIADDHHIFVEGLKKVLAYHPEHTLEVIGVAHTGKEALHLCRTLRPDILLLDLNMPELDGLAVLEGLKTQIGPPKVVVLTMYDDPKIVKSAFKQGAEGYLLKDGPLEELSKAIIEVKQGNNYLGHGVGFSEGYRSGDHPEPAQQAFDDRFIQKHHLTPRELEVLHLIVQAKSNKEIGKELYISEQTVSVHRKNIMRKLSVSNTAALIKVAYEFGMGQ